MVYNLYCINHLISVKTFVIVLYWSLILIVYWCSSTACCVSFVCFYAVNGKLEEVYITDWQFTRILFINIILVNFIILFLKLKGSTYRYHTFLFFFKLSWIFVFLCHMLLWLPFSFASFINITFTFRIFSTFLTALVCLYVHWL